MTATGRDDRIVQANGVEICVEAFGDRGAPPVLLIMGSAASMDWWENEFCLRLAAGPRFVVRYDHRDTGRSVNYEPGAPGYTFRDLVGDAVGLLDALALPSAHLVGMSMGGAIAQVIALEHPDRVASLTLISTSSVSGGRSDLQQMSDEAVAEFPTAEPDWSDRAQVIDYIVAFERACAGRSSDFDETGWRALVGRAFDRARSIEASMTNHELIDAEDPPARPLGDLDLPALVVHGRDDPVLSLGHGLALAEEIPGAELLVLDDIGHELPARAWGAVVPAILALTSAGR